MKSPLLLIVLSVIHSYSSAQVDYLKIKDNVCPAVCGWYPHETLLEIEPLMRSVDTTTLTKESMYYYLDDAAMIYYQLYAYDLDSTHAMLSGYFYGRASAFRPKLASPCWNAALIYARIGECDKMYAFFDRYLLLEKKKALTEAKLKNIEYIKGTCER